MAKGLPAFQFRTTILKIALVVFTALFPKNGYSWGPRGHALICEAAIHLIKDKGLKRYLMSKAQGLIYLCNVPDSYWKNIKGTESGYSTHFFEPDVIGISLESIPLQFSEFEKMSVGKTNILNGEIIRSASQELGSLWWRADQFARLSLDAGKRAVKSGIPHKEDDDIYQMWVMMGLLGHFVGDNAQPFHTTGDYDGWQKDHGGIHGYYESDIVNELPYDFMASIIRYSPKARKELKLTKDSSSIEAMKLLSSLSYKDINLVYSLDPIIKKSSVLRERGMEIKTYAERKPAAEAVNKLEPLLIKHLSRGATLLADQWEKIFFNSGKPSIEKDKSYRFPHQFEFIAPDYTENK